MTPEHQELNNLEAEMRDEGGPAFPCGSYGTKDQEQPPIYAGLSLRDYFAAAALTGMLADSESVGSNQEIGEAAYRVADAMLKVRHGIIPPIMPRPKSMPTPKPSDGTPRP